MENNNKFENVKTISFDVYFKGDGCVNYDSSYQKYTLTAMRIGSHTYSSLMDEKDIPLNNDNIKLSKKSFKKFFNEETGKEEYKYVRKVSSECIGKACFAKEVEFESDRIAFIKDILYKALATPAMILKGFMFASNGGLTIKKASPITLTDAKEISLDSNISPYTNVIDFDVHSKAGERTKTSLYNIENVGEAIYMSRGFLRLDEMQFISGDSTYDRDALGTETDGGKYESIFLEALKNNFGDFNFGFDFYYMKNSIYQDEWAERGVKLYKENVDFLVKDMIKRLFKVAIYRKKSYLKFVKINVSVLYEDENGNPRTEKIELNNINDIDKYTFNYYERYIKADAEKIMNNRENTKKLKEALRNKDSDGETNGSKGKTKGKSRKNTEADVTNDNEGGGE